MSYTLVISPSFVSERCTRKESAQLHAEKPYGTTQQGLWGDMAGGFVQALGWVSRHLRCLA